MNDKISYEEAAEAATQNYFKGHNDEELEQIKKFITKINTGCIKNQNEAVNSFRILKSKVKNKRLVKARQLIYGLYESKKITKKLYNILIKKLKTTYK